MFELESEIKSWKKLLRKNRTLEDGYIEELEQHLRDEIEKNITAGMSEAEAFNKAVENIGDVETINEDYFKSNTTNKVSGRPPWQSPKWMPTMLWNYYKTAVRNLKRNKGFAFINILGLSIGITVFLLITLFTQNETTYDEFHKDGDRIYRLLREATNADGKYRIAVTSGPFAPAIMNDFPDVVDDVLRVYPAEGLVTYEDKKFWEEEFYIADNNFFGFFSYELITGDPGNVLDGPNKVVISNRMAEKYFGNENPVGKVIELDKEDSFEITGIFNSDHPNSHLNFDFVASIETFKNTSMTNEWWSNSLLTYVKVKPGTDLKQFDYQLDQFMLKYFGDDFAVTNKPITLALEPVENIYLNSNTKFDRIEHGNREVNVIFSLVALFVLIIASINFMNLSSAKAIKRAREIGIRKVVGAEKKNLVVQFLLESTLFSFVAGLFALATVIIVIPSFESLVNTAISLPFNDMEFIGGSVLFLLLLGIVSGSYPAFILSNFRPVNALKESKPNEGKGLFRKVLVVTQFALSVILISGVGVVYSQTEFLINKDSGFDKDQVMLIRFNNREAFNERFKLQNDFMRLSSVENVSLMSGEPGGFYDNLAFKIKERGGEYVRMRSLIADYNYIPMFDLELASGRNFSEDYSLDSTHAVIINEAAARNLGWTNQEAIGKQMAIRFYNEDIYRSVIGVVKDYHFFSLQNNIQPLVIFPGDFHLVMGIKIRTANVSSAVNNIQKVFESTVEGFPFRYEFLDETFEANYNSEKKQLSVLSLLALLAVFIAALGLLGLATHAAELRKKEIGIRKILGATIESVAMLMIFDFLKLVLIANIIAIPVSWVISEYWLADFAYKTDLTVVPFVLTLIITVTISVITTGYQTMKAVFVNPVETLRSE